MKYEDPNMQAYFNSLPLPVRAAIDRAGIDVCSPGMLQRLGEHYRNQLGYTDPKGQS